MIIKLIVILLFLDKIYSQSVGLKEAFIGVSKALANYNHGVTVVLDENSSDAIKSFAAEAVAGFPHFVAQFTATSRFQLNTSALVVLDSIKTLRTFNQQTTLSFAFLASHQIIIYCLDADLTEIAGIGGSRYENKIIQSEYFIIESQKSITLHTFDYFQAENCSGMRLVEVNRFDRKTKKWLHENFKINKFTNFNGCELHFASISSWPTYLVRKIDYENEYVAQCDGILCGALIDLSSSMNFSYDMNKFLPETRQTLFPDKPCDLLFGVSSLAAVSEGERQAKKHSSAPYAYTRPYIFIDMFIAIPPGDEYDSFEKMVLPFDEPTWILISVTFTSAFATIFILKLVKGDVASCVMGRETLEPALNVIRAFFGISQILCPGRNFARYLLMLFILFSLVIRTAYQGKMFEFLQKEMRKPTVKTIDEMIEQNFTFYMPTGFRDEYPEVLNGTIIDQYSWREAVAAFNRLYRAGTKTAFYLYKGSVAYTFIRLVNRTEEPKLLKNRFMVEPMVLLFDQRHFLFEVFDRKIQQLFEANLIDYYLTEAIEYHNLKKLEKHKDPYKVLTLGELEAGFVISMTPLAFSILAFIIEWLITLKDLLVFHFTFKAYFSLKRGEPDTQIGLNEIKMALMQEILEERAEMIQ